MLHASPFPPRGRKSLTTSLYRSCFAAALALLLPGARPSLAREDWPQFRGPTGQGLSTAKNVPTEWSADSHVAWKIDLPGRGWSSPVLSEGKLYLTAAVPDPATSATTLDALCLQPEDGKILWETPIFHPDPGSVASLHSKNSPASPTPIVDGGRIYVHFGHMGTAALDLEGKVLWRQTGLKYSPVHGNGGSPLLLGGALYFGCDGDRDPFLVSLDASTGEIRWKTPRNSTAHKPFSFCTPLAIEVGGATQVISPCSGFVGGYNPKDGHEIWRVSYGEGYSVVPRPVFAHGLLYVSSGFDTAVLYAIKPEGAAGDVTATHVAWTQRKAAPLTPSPLALGDELYTVSDGGIAMCLDAVTGEVHWSERLGGGFSASPVTAEGRIYFLNESGVTFVVEAAKAYHLLAKNDLAERALASPAVTDGALFLRTEKSLWKITSAPPTRK